LVRRTVVVAAGESSTGQSAIRPTRNGNTGLTGVTDRPKS
jgi:hypothetical protein